MLLFFIHDILQNISPSLATIGRNTLLWQTCQHQSISPPTSRTQLRLLSPLSGARRTTTFTASASKPRISSKASASAANPTASPKWLTTSHNTQTNPVTTSTVLKLTSQPKTRISATTHKVLYGFVLNKYGPRTWPIRPSSKRLNVASKIYYSPLSTIHG